MHTVYRMLGITLLCEYIGWSTLLSLTNSKFGDYVYRIITLNLNNAYQWYS